MSPICSVRGARRPCLSRRSRLAASPFALYFIDAARLLWPRVKCGGGSPHFFVLDDFLDCDVKDALEDVVVQELDAVGYDLVELRRGGTQVSAVDRGSYRSARRRSGHGRRLRDGVARARSAARRQRARVAAVRACRSRRQASGRCRRRPTGGGSSGSGPTSWRRSTAAGSKAKISRWRERTGRKWRSLELRSREIERRIPLADVKEARLAFHV